MAVLQRPGIFEVTVHIRQWPPNCSLSETCFHSNLQDKLIFRKIKDAKPAASVVLNFYLKQTNFPPWTSYFVKYEDVLDDQRGLSHFNWKIDSVNYHILRTGCWPYIKYHCTKRLPQDLSYENQFYRIIKIINLGLPCLAYGLAAFCLISHKEIVHTDKGSVEIYFWYIENKPFQF